MHQKKTKTKTKKKKRTGEFFDASRRVHSNRSNTFYGMMFLFPTYWDFLLTDRHISKIGGHSLPSSMKYYRLSLTQSKEEKIRKQLNILNFSTIEVSQNESSFSPLQRTPSETRSF